MMKILSRRGAYMLIGGILVVLGAGSNIGLRRLYDTRPAYVNVRWAASVDDAARQRLEQQYGLTRGEFREQRTWGYYLTNQSSANIEAMVRDPQVEDTFHINRVKMRLALRVEREPDVPASPDIPGPYRVLSLGTLLVGAVVLGWGWLQR
jgi:hypothetical protein